MKQRIDFTQGNMLRSIVLFSIPLITGELLQNLYNSVDALVAGNFVDQYLTVRFFSFQLARFTSYRNAPYTACK